MSLSALWPTPADLAAQIDKSVQARWQAARASALASLGARLLSLGLNQRAVCSRFGVRCVLHAPLKARSKPPEAEVPPAALLVHLFVAGEPMDTAALRGRLGQDFILLESLGLVVSKGPLTWATVALMPVGPSLVVSDRADVLSGDNAALIADDSAFHLIGSLPARLGGKRWLDVGTGSAIVPLARPGLAPEIRGTDINERAIAMAALGARLSGASHVELQVASLLAGSEDRAPWDLITFNAPIPGAVSNEVNGPTYSHSDTDLVPSFLQRAGDLLAPGGNIILHSWQAEDSYPACLELPGRVIAARYSPPGFRPAFGITWWQPHAPDEVQLVPVRLSTSEPHVMRSRIAPLAS